MNNEDKILELLGAMQTSMQSMQSDIQKINGRLDSLEAKVDDLAEGQDELRTSVNALLDWSDRVSSIEQLKLPKIG